MKRPASTQAPSGEPEETGALDLEVFMKRIERCVLAGPLSKATKMLKKDRFELFVEIDEQGLAGVVKSQTDATLVYACRLAASGEFGCCTQNLNRCGGLRGGPCKHLLVLVLGLARTGSVGADALEQWLRRATRQDAVIDTEALGAVLLRYQGAQAGELDWRPAETVPEDFYAF